VSDVLAGRTALITGASQGLGLEIARAYIDAGAAGVCICARAPDTLEAALAELDERAAAGQRVLGEVADVSNPDDVDRLVAAALGAMGKVTILVCNAGVYGPKGTIDETDWLEWRRAVEINLLGSMLPARALAAHLIERGYGKIIQLSGGGATAPLPRLSAYAASKAGVVRFAETLAEELRDRGVDVNSIAPGPLNTKMLDEVLGAGPERVGTDFYRRAVEQHSSGGASLQRAAGLAVFLASAGSDGISGKLLSAVWDPWSQLPEHLEDLDSDVYTLRRVTPRERGLDWEAV